MLFAGDELQESHIKTFRTLLEEKGNPLAVIDGKLVAGKYLLNGNFELPDRVKEIFGGTATIFMGNVRVSTNVLKEDGSRAINTRLIPAYQYVREGRSIAVKLHLGVPVCRYDPLRTAGASCRGLFVGATERFPCYLQNQNRCHLDPMYPDWNFIFLTCLLPENGRKAKAAQA
jgi:methyl-accepting chemotaxis protein